MRSHPARWSWNAQAAEGTPHDCASGEWQTAARGLSSSTTQHRVAPTTHAGQHVEAAAAPYLAPEFSAEADGTVSIDVFGLGSTAYLVLTGQPPAQSRAELMERLTSEGGLHPSAVSDSVPDDVDALIALATDPRVTARFADVEEFLEHLDEIPGASVDPDPVELDPWNATKDAELPDGSVVLEVPGALPPRPRPGARAAAGPGWRRSATHWGTAGVVRRPDACPLPRPRPDAGRS